jgi:hypothetical protein
MFKSRNERTKTSSSGWLVRPRWFFPREKGWANATETACSQPSYINRNLGVFCMPRGRSTFTKRQKEQARQQKQRDKNERKTQRKQDKPEGGVVDEVDELREMREHAEAQAALFRIGDEDDEPGSSDLSLPHGSKAVDR